MMSYAIRSRIQDLQGQAWAYPLARAQGRLALAVWPPDATVALSVNA